MELIINGELKEISCTTVNDLLHSLGIDPRQVAVERNLEFVPKKVYESMNLSAGDQIEIVHFVGGG